MTVVSLKELKEKLPKGKRLLGIDHSAAAWGLALSNPELTMATPLKTIRRGKFTADIAELAKTCREYGVGGIVIGMPYNMDGTEGPRVDSVKHFAFNLGKAKEALGFDPLIAFQDERLSSFGADEILKENKNLNKDQRRALVDAQAALDILRAALERMG